MTDIVKKETRSRMMAGIGSKGTWVEKHIQTVLDRLEIEYESNVANFSGKPDLFVKDFSSVILIHGCYWHGHGCHLSSWPDDNSEFWRNKIQKTMERDKSNLRLYQARYWVLTIWECALRGKHAIDRDQLATRIDDWLRLGKRNKVITGRGQHGGAVGKASA